MGWTNIKSVQVSTTVTAVDYPCRFRGAYFSNTSPAGATFIIRNGTPTAEILFTIDVPVSAPINMVIPDAGIRVPGKLWIKCDASCNATILFD